MNSVHGSAIVEVLTPIWTRVLRVDSVGLEDNFFDLGGDSSLALQLFNEIALATGRDLPPILIYEAPTIAALASLLDQQETPRVPPVLRLKPGSQSPPVFIAHGLGGTVMDFYQVVKHVKTSHPILGMQAKGIDGLEEPLDRIEEMAQYSLEAVRSVQPQGPYFLVGFSLGGLVALEMAQRLVASGERIGMLAMLDSYPHVSVISRTQRLGVKARQLWRRAANRLTWLGIKPPYQTVIEVSSTPALQHFRDCAYRALQRYQPRFYPGKIDFVRAAIPTDFPAKPSAVWSHLAAEFTVQTVPGDHLGIMTAHFDRLGMAISRCLQNAGLF